jgi:hypothetical protein
MRQFTKDVYVDLTTVEGKPLSRNAMIQISSIPDLPMGLDQVVTRDGQQVQTVGHHWPGSRPLNKKQRDNMERIGVCLSCHQDIPNGTPSIKRLSQMLKNSSRTPSTDEEHRALLQSINRNVLDIFSRVHSVPPRHEELFLQKGTEPSGK